MITRSRAQLGLGTPLIMAAMAVGAPSLAQAQQPFHVYNGASDYVGAVDFPTLQSGLTEIDLGTVEASPNSGALVLVYNSVYVPSGATVTFVNPPGRNSPVHILSLGNVVINGVIDVSGKAPTGSPVQTTGGQGGPGGFPGGNARIGDSPPAPGGGPGGGLAIANCADDTFASATGGGAYSYGGYLPGGSSNNTGEAYGSPLLVPMLGGSGGGGSDAQLNSSNTLQQFGGGGGGGGILIASDTHIEVNGSILALGGRTNMTGNRTCKSPGSGGAIRLVARQVVLGPSPVLDVSGGLISAAWGQTNEKGLAGRVRIDTLYPELVDRSRVFPAAADFNSTNRQDQYSAVYSIGSFMAAFPDTMPRIRITEVAGTDITQATGTIEVLLPGTATELQLIKFVAEGIGNRNVRVVVSPAQGSRTVMPAIFMETSVEDDDGEQLVPIPPNVRTRIDIWTE